VTTTFVTEPPVRCAFREPADAIQDAIGHLALAQSGTTSPARGRRRQVRLREREKDLVVLIGGRRTASVSDVQDGPLDSATVDSATMDSATMDSATVDWVLAAVGGDRILSMTGLRDGGSPWLFRYAAGRGEGSAVLRVRAPDEAELQALEVRGVALARVGGVPVADVIAARADDKAVLLLIEYVRGSSHQPVEPDPARLAALGAIAARISAVDPGSAELPIVTHPVPDVDFDEMRDQAEPQPLLTAAQERVAAIVPDGPAGFVHGDLWSGNTLWCGTELAAVIDWDCAGRGAAGVDLGSLRCDAAMCYGLDAAGHVLAGWEREAGRAAESLAYWDAVAGLSSPPDIGWFAPAISGMTGRPDLTEELLRERRDAFLADALERLG
jgi:aminoglycoside phosphotransferase (APT) family kinase protein